MICIILYTISVFPTCASRQNVTAFHQDVTGDKPLISFLVLEMRKSWKAHVYTHTQALLIKTVAIKGKRDSLAEPTKLSKAREAQRHTKPKPAMVFVLALLYLLQLTPTWHFPCTG